jgi:hypothetical protein
MLRITLDHGTLELLLNLREPLELCDEAGTLRGTFVPEAADLVELACSCERMSHAEHGNDLGEEISIYGYEQDLE